MRPEHVSGTVVLARAARAAAARPARVAAALPTARPRPAYRRRGRLVSPNPWTGLILGRITSASRDRDRPDLVAADPARACDTTAAPGRACPPARGSAAADAEVI